MHGENMNLDGMFSVSTKNAHNNMQLYISLKKPVHVSAQRRHPQGIRSTKEYKPKTLISAV